jgi:hypothetical protein
MLTRFALGLALLMTGPASAATDDLPSCPAADGLKVASGDYLETAYIETLRRSGSPLVAATQAEKTNVAQSVEVRRDGDVLNFLIVWNWHEGDWLFALQPDGRLDRDQNAYQVERASLEVLDRCSFRLASPGGPVSTYRFVGKSEDFVARTVLTGTYRDDTGRAYKFSAAGQATFPGQKFSYKVELDQVLDPYDFFRVGNEQHFIAFHRDGDNLTLYPVVPDPNSGGFGSPDLYHPIANLRRVSDR